jgi:hypothetical protein
MAEKFNVKLSELSPANKSVIEVNAASEGISPQEYLTRRGGVNPVTNMYGDSFNPMLDLTDAEYKAALAGKTGIAQGQAINAATEAKRQKFLAESGTAFKAPDGKFYKSEREYREIANRGGAVGASGSAGVGGPSLESQSETRSAYALLLSEFSRYGLEALVTPLQDLIKQGLSGPEFQIALRNTDAYQKRFAGNTERIKKGLVALSPGEYLALEDQYQNIMRNYGLPASYYTKDSIGTQAGFNKLIANDVSAVELEERVLTAQKRVLDAAPEVMTALKRFYPDIKNGEILAYTLDPEKGLEDIRKKVTAAEIGGAALAAGLGTSLTDAEYLRRYGVTAETARAGFGAIGGGLERGRQLASIYQQPDYTQAVAEEEVFNLPGQTESQQKRKKIIGLEKAEFGGQTGVSSGALSQNRAGSY